MEQFPQSKLEKQILAGKQVTHNGIKLPVLPCTAAKSAQKNIKSLSDYVIAHEKDLLMAYAIIPLTGGDDLIHRYLYLQQFLKESRQFGSQCSTSEKKAV